MPFLDYKYFRNMEPEASHNHFFKRLYIECYHLDLLFFYFFYFYNAERRQQIGDPKKKV